MAKIPSDWAFPWNIGFLNLRWENMILIALTNQWAPMVILGCPLNICIFHGIEIWWRRAGPNKSPKMENLAKIPTWGFTNQTWQKFKSIEKSSFLGILELNQTYPYCWFLWMKVEAHQLDEIDWYTQGIVQYLPPSFMYILDLTKCFAFNEFRYFSRVLNMCIRYFSIAKVCSGVKLFWLFPEL